MFAARAPAAEAAIETAVKKRMVAIYARRTGTKKGERREEYRLLMKQAYI